VAMRQHNFWCVCVALVQHTSPHRMPRIHTKCFAAASPQLTFYIFKFLNSVTLTRNLRAPWRWCE